MQRMWPHGNAKVPGLLEGIVETAPIVFLKYGLLSNVAIAHAMAQFSEECGEGLEMVENMNYSAQRLLQVFPSHFRHPSDADRLAHKPKAIANRVYNSRMGNRPGTDDGWNFRGRGLSQLTGRENYEALSKRTGLDLLTHPEFLSDPEHALECGVADFVMCGCLGYANRDDLEGVSSLLNVGHLVRDHSKINGYNDRRQQLARWKEALKVS